MWAIADQCLHVTGERFWKLTVRQFRALHDCYQEREERMDLRFGVWLSLYESAHLPKGERARNPWEWFGNRNPGGGSSGGNSSQPQTPEQAAWLLKFQLMTAGGGKSK